MPQQTAEAEIRGRVEDSLLRNHQKEAAVELPANTQLQFSPDPEHHRVFIKVSDSRTGRVIIEIPPEKVARAMDQLLENLNGSKVDLQA